MSDQQRCIQCTWDGVKLVKMCPSHQRIDELETKLAAAEAAHLTDALVQEQLQRELAAAEAANKELAASAVDGVKYRGLVKDYNHLTAKLAEAEAERDFYKLRCNELLEVKDQFREPELTILCNVLANGKAKAGGE